MNYHPDVLAAHAEFGGDLQAMQALYDRPDHIARIAALEAQLAERGAENEKLEKERDYWQSQHDERTRQLGMSDSEATPPAPKEPDFSKSIADVIKEESASGAAAGWRSCTGCHETNEGYETGHFPYSKMFGCYVGSGCSECGGIGVTWEYWSEADLKAMAENIPTPPAPKVTGAMSIFDKHGLSSLIHKDQHDAVVAAIEEALTAAQEAGKP